VSITGTGFSILSGSGAVTLAPTQTASVSVQFAPTAAGAATGSVGISSNATASPASVSLGGTGVAPVSHSVTLTWSASNSTVAGYNVYRSTVSGGSYSKVNSSLLAALNYADGSVTSGSTYYYVTTAVDSSGNESVYSNQVSATVP
jgi:fibronectin type 3 domain-containing protein